MVGLREVRQRDPVSFAGIKNSCRALSPFAHAPARAFFVAGKALSSAAPPRLTGAPRFFLPQLRTKHFTNGKTDEELVCRKFRELIYQRAGM